jgi:SAM-dependent methyltransferase
MHHALPGRTVTLTGTDVNADSIAWCSRHIPGIRVLPNDFLPPLPFADASFDVTYNFSVFTHLSETAQKAWAAELLRVLRPGGLLIASTHGDFYRDRLAQDREAAQNGELVVQAQYAEGKKWYLALHPPRYVREELLRGFTEIRHVPVDPAFNLHQDLWVASKPA